MTTTTSTPLRPRAAVLDAAVAAIERQRRAQVDLMADAAAYVLSAPEPVDADGGALFGERLLQVAGEGAPLVCEFAIIELAARLGRSVDAASTLVAQAVELQHRLPRVWALTVEGVIQPRLAQQIAERTVCIGREIVWQADRWLAVDPKGLGIKEVEATLDTLQLHEDPDRIVGLEESLLADRHVTLMRDKLTPSAVRVEMLLEPDDAKAFDHAVGDVAASLKGLGDEDDLQVRRAKAVGVLASPQAALDLLDHGVAPTRRAPVADLYLHLGLADQAKAAGGTPGPVDVEGLRVVSTDLIRRWLDAPDLRINVRPVLHLPGSHLKTPGPRSDTWSTPPNHDRAVAPRPRPPPERRSRPPSILQTPLSAGPPSIATTHPRRCVRSSSSATPSASSRTATARPATPTSTTSTPGSTPIRAVHPVRPSGQPGTALPATSPVQDPHRLDLPARPRRLVRLDQPHRPRDHHRLAASTKHLPLTPQPHGSGVTGMRLSEATSAAGHGHALLRETTTPRTTG